MLVTKQEQLCNMEKPILNCFNHYKFLWACCILCISWPTLQTNDWQCSCSAAPHIVCIISAEFLGDIFLPWNTNPFHKLLTLKKIKKSSQVVWYLTKSTLFQDPPRKGQSWVLQEQLMPQLPTHEHEIPSFLPSSSSDQKKVHQGKPWSKTLISTSWPSCICRH